MIKLTAQFVARNGKNFLTGLSSREHTNPQFSFLKPTHSLFGFFTSLCDAYSRVLMPPKGTRDRLQKDATDRWVGMEQQARCGYVPHGYGSRGSYSWYLHSCWSPQQAAVTLGSTVLGPA
jgi:hypothetical protein